MRQSTETATDRTVPPALSEAGSTTLITAACAVIGAALALVIGLVWVALAPGDGFADLAAAGVTKVVLVPLGAVIGGFGGWRRSHTA